MRFLLFVCLLLLQSSYCYTFSSTSMLNFSIHKQPALNLCWAAVAASISKFYSSAAPYEQCDLANYAFHSTTCCKNIPICDKVWYLDSALMYTGNLNGNIVAGEPSWDKIKEQITNGYVIAVRIEWSGDHGGHFVVIHGFHDDGSIDVQDPWPTKNPGRIAYTKLALFYDDAGHITHYYLTKKATE